MFPLGYFFQIFNWIFIQLAGFHSNIKEIENISAKFRRFSRAKPQFSKVLTHQNCVNKKSKKTSVANKFVTLEFFGGKVFESSKFSKVVTKSFKNRKGSLEGFMSIFLRIRCKKWKFWSMMLKETFSKKLEFNSRFLEFLSGRVGITSKE